MRFILRLSLLVCILFPLSARAQVDMDHLIDSTMRIAARQYGYLASTLPAGRAPKTFQHGELVTSGTGWWCSGFYPGTLWYLYEYLKDSSLKVEALRATEQLEKEKDNKGTHDLGFMLFCSYGNAYRLTGNPAYKAIILQASRSLSSRYNATVECIKSWDNRSEGWLYPVIIDNMMNLEMLLWAAKNSGHAEFGAIARRHADKTMANHYRPDYSCYHVLDYDATTGALKGRYNLQGLNDNSSWSRGQAWGLYGYTMLYRETKNEIYLQQACNIADFLLGHPHLPADKIPYWDYDAPDIPNALRDASAAAIMASALIELSQYAGKAASDNYRQTAGTMLRSLSSPQYLAEPGANGGFLLKHGVGFFNAGSEVDVPLSYADYYFVEAMLRWKKTSNNTPQF